MERMPKVIKVDERIIQLEKQREQLTARVREYETFGVIEIMARNVNVASFVKETEKRIATLEQQLNDEKGICEALRSQNSDAVEEVQKLEQQIQQAEKRGYELCIKYNFLTDKLYVTYEGARMGEDAWIKEQAIAERDNIAEGSKMVGGEKK